MPGAEPPVGHDPVSAAVARRGRLARLTAGVAGAAAVLTVLTLAARLVGFARWFALNAWVGPNEVGTAYSTANTVPNVLFEVAAGGALAGAVVPLLAGPIARHLRHDVDRTASAMLTWATAVLVPVGAVTYLAAPLAVAALGSPDAGADQLALATTLLRIFAVQIPLYGVGVVLSGVLQAHRRFVWPAVAPLLSSLVVMSSYYVVGVLSPDDPSPADLTSTAVAALGWGTTAGVVVLSLPLLVPVARLGIRLRPTFAFPDGVAGRARSLALAGAGGLVAQQLSVVVAVKVANTFGTADGTLNLHQYAQAVILLPYAVLAVPVATAMFPRLADHAAAGRRDALARESALSTRVIVVVAAAGAAALVAAAPRVEQVFAEYARGTAGVAGLGGGVAWGAASVVGLALVFHLSRVLYAMENNRTAVAAISLGWFAVAVSAVVGAVVLVGGTSDSTRTLAVLGGASSLGTLVGGLALLLGVRRALGGAGIAGVARTAAVAVVGAGLGAAAGRWVVGLGPDDAVATALLLGAAGGLLAVVLTLAVIAVGDREALVRLRHARRPAAGAAGDDEDVTPDQPVQTDQTDQPHRAEEQM
ncbi:virulence factor MviN [Serinibacter arcticus]|uniref:Virulence factor MviN n=1 Tax=Serinibacter arcticus TaxID=1655435 RepID=A0A2U1ZSP7_9MICO|nr:lipid II flippase MurJ [Serinibacter arcticus]PWD49981.1 virulence factor MviN [Serinibacter arcticus]